MLWGANADAEEEKKSMSHEFPTQMHKIFRLLDSRRYSMYYNRWKSYELMLKHEQRTSHRFDWVVHARLDMLWGAPIAEVSKWSTAAVVVPDSWWSDVPDTFALLPRQYSDIYFDLNELVQHDAMCIGGPNVNISGLNNTEVLVMRGLSRGDMPAVQRSLCKHVDYGFSEQILKRKLKQSGVSLSDGTLKFRSFFMAVVRAGDALSDLCMYLQSTRQIGWVIGSQPAHAGYYSACLRLVHEMRLTAMKHVSDASQVTPLSAQAKGAWEYAQKHNCTPSSAGLNMCTRSVRKQEFFGQTCLMNHKISDW